jgi:hypothetical protein
MLLKQQTNAEDTAPERFNRTGTPSPITFQFLQVVSGWKA